MAVCASGSQWLRIVAIGCRIRAGGERPAAQVRRVAVARLLPGRTGNAEHGLLLVAVRLALVEQGRQAPVRGPPYPVMRDGFVMPSAEARQSGRAGVNATTSA